MSSGQIDVCGRIGGDEFVVVGRGDEFAAIFEKRFKEELEKQNKNLNKPYELDASVGYVTTIPEESDSLIELIQQADAEMYKVKKTKKNHR